MIRLNHIKNSLFTNFLEEIYSYNLKEAILKENFNKSIKSNGNKLSNIELFDQNNHKTSLKTITNRNLLVYRLSKVCPACLENGIKIINQLKDSIGGNNCIILSNFASPREMKIFSSLYDIKVPFFSYTDRFNIVADMDSFELKPYYFLLDTDFRINFT